MSADPLFSEIMPDNGIGLKEIWNSKGTVGTAEWGIVMSETYAYDRGSLGDYISYGYPGINTSISSLMKGKKILLVNRHRPDAAVPATSYRDVARVLIRYKPKSVSFLQTLYKQVTLVISEPSNDDSNYVAVGHCVRIFDPAGGDGKPNPGDYYLLHKRYVQNLADVINGHDLNSDGLKLVSSVPGFAMFFGNKYKKILVRTDDDIRTCCANTVVDPSGKCSVLSEDTPLLAGSLSCRQFTDSYCTIDDIKPGGKCYGMCTKDSSVCDQAKQNYCNDNPLDSLCDCINAKSRPDYMSLVNTYPEIYNQSVPACFYSKCKQESDKVFKTSSIEEVQQGIKCANDMNVINNSINSAIFNNSQAASQPGTILTVTNAPSVDPPQINDETDKTLIMIFMFVMFIVCVIFGYKAYKSNVKSNVKKQHEKQHENTLPSYSGN